MTRYRNSLIVLLAAALFAGPAGFAASSARADDTELAKHMEVIEEGMKKLRRSLKKADENPASLEAIAKMQTAAVASKALTPAMAATLPEADRAKFAQAYRKDMAAMIADVCQMEIALLDGDNAKAQELHKKLGEHEDAGHKKYIKEEK